MYGQIIRLITRCRLDFRGGKESCGKIRWEISDYYIYGYIGTIGISNSIYFRNYIDSKRNVWESDRNFYGKSININDIHLKENTSEEFSVTSKEFKKVKTNGKIYYYLEQDGNEISVSTKEYLKYVADCDEVTL